MHELKEELIRARNRWTHRGKSRPDFAVEPKSGQESVWDYPRPPKIDNDPRLVVVKFKDQIIAESSNTVRVLETASPPVFYIPPTDVNFDYLQKQEMDSLCEWKGLATYFAVVLDDLIINNAGWGYLEPFSDFEQIKDYISFYPSKLDCFVANEKVKPQPGGFYGGWVTSEIVGPFKGEPGTSWW